MNLLNEAGIQIKTMAEIKADLTAAYQSIYGLSADDLGSNTPDGQMLNIFAQMVADNLDLMVQVYSSFDPDQAIGTTLDARCALNAVKRRGGTYTTVQVNVTTDRAVNLDGLDSKVNDADGTGFTVSDNAGNQFILSNSYSIPGPGTTLLTFRAKDTGGIQTTQNTIQVAVSVILGVLSINNPNPSLTIGLDQEKDGNLKIRRQKSVAISSQGYLDGMRAALLNIDGVTAAEVYENNTGGDDGIINTGHSVWCIVEGGADSEIAKAVYSKRPAGIGMKGSIVAYVTRPNGALFGVSFDRTTTQRLYSKFTLDAINGNLLVTGNIATGNIVVGALSSTSGIAVGMLVRAAGIPVGTTIAAVGPGSQVTLSQAPTITTVGASVSVVPIVVSVLVTAIANAVSLSIYEPINVNRISTLLQGINTNALITFPAGCGVSRDNISFLPNVYPLSRNNKFTLSGADVVVV